MPGYGYRGRYSSSSYDDEGGRRGFVKVLSSRSWFLIIPLIGVVWANARQVTPQVKQLKAKIAEEEKALDAQRTQTLSSANRIRTHVSALAALKDTFDVRFTRVDSLTETISTFLDADRKASAKLTSELDSLRQGYSLVAARVAAYSDTFKRLGPVLDSLAAVTAARNEETQRLWAETVANLDQTDRILKPDAYRKKNALVTGQGDYPSRDELPER